MTEQPRHLLTVEAADLSAIREELADLKHMLEGVTMAPKLDWVTVAEYAALVGRDRSTVNRHIKAGRIEAKNLCGTMYVRRP